MRAVRGRRLSPVSLGYGEDGQELVLDAETLPLLRIKKAEKLLSAFGLKLRRLINSETGRLHPHYSVAGTKAGRWSASDPNIQQLPNDSDTRRVIVAAPGNVLVGVDYSQMELRAAAWISG